MENDHLKKWNILNKGQTIFQFNLKLKTDTEHGLVMILINYLLHILK